MHCMVLQGIAMRGMDINLKERINEMAIKIDPELKRKLALKEREEEDKTVTKVLFGIWIGAIAVAGAVIAMNIDDDKVFPLTAFLWMSSIIFFIGEIIIIRYMRKDTNPVSKDLGTFMGYNLANLFVSGFVSVCSMGWVINYQLKGIAGLKPLLYILVGGLIVILLKIGVYNLLIKNAGVKKN